MLAVRDWIHFRLEGIIRSQSGHVPVPIAIVEKGKGPGSHLLSGSVMRPGPFKSLFPDAAPGETPGIFEEAHKESVYFLRKNGKIKIPTPPDLNNHGNWVVSISQLSRFMAETAEEYGAYMLPETDAQTLLVEDGAVRGIRTGIKGLDRDGAEKPGAAPATEVHAQVTVLERFGSPSTEHLVDSVAEIVARDNAEVRYLAVQEQVEKSGLATSPMYLENSETNGKDKTPR